MTRDRLLGLLLRPIPEDARARLGEEIAALDARLAALVPRPERVRELAEARLAGSMTLGERPTASRRIDLGHWLAANTRMAELVRDDAPLALAPLRELCALLRGLPGAAPLRTRPISVGLFPTPAPEDIEPLLAPMLQAVEQRTAEVHPIAGAALLEQWLVTVHPFDDGNGRTSRLAADWALARHGYPPASYPSLVASMKALIDHGDEPFTPEETCRALLDGIRHTIALIS